MKRLQYAAARSRQCSSLSHNFIREHFEGESCSAIYEVHGSNKLGEGSYGSVYLATHKLTGDERAVKVMNVDRVTSYYLRKLHTEISILKCVDHPNIVKVRDKCFPPIFSIMECMKERYENRGRGRKKAGVDEKEEGRVEMTRIIKAKGGKARGRK